MQYIINTIVDLIAERLPDPGSELILLINGFEDLKIYAELSSVVYKKYFGSEYSLNIKLAKKKWEELSKKSDTTTVQFMTQNKWVAEKESITFYRNQHNVNILLLMGTENEEDTGGLINCFSITDDWMLNRLEGKYHKIFECCFTSELTKENKDCINAAYKSLFEFVPADIYKMSKFSDKWFKQFSTINEFCNEFAANLENWGLPNRKLEELKPKSILSKNNFLREEFDFISRKLFQRMSQKAYVSLEKKIKAYATEGEYGGNNTNWESYGFSNYDEFSKAILEFARGERVAKNQERLLKVDYIILDDILKLKTKDPTPVKISEISVSGRPIEVIMNTALNALIFAKKQDISNVSEIRFCFTEANIVTGFTDNDDSKKREILASLWKNVCIHVNGIFDYINRNEWKLFGKPIKITCNSDDFFNPNCVTEQLNRAVSVTTGTNTLNKIRFCVSVLDEANQIINYGDNGHNQELLFDYVWKFENEAFWLYDFKDILDEPAWSVPNAKRIPVGTMKSINNTTIVKSKDEFFDIYEENTPDFSFDMCSYVQKKTEKIRDIGVQSIALSFEALGTAFCNLAKSITEEGFYKSLCGDKVSNYIDCYNNVVYVKDEERIINHKFAENEVWLKDAYLYSFVVLEDSAFIENEMDPECIIIPSWHPAALQKIAAQMQFMIDGLNQVVEKYDKDEIDIKNVDEFINRYSRMTEIQSTIDLFPTVGNNYMGVMGSYGTFCVYGNSSCTSHINTRVSDLLRKEVIYDESFRSSELTKMNDDASMIYDVLKDYNKAMPSVECSLSVVFINPPDLQPIIAAISKYTKDIRAKDKEAIINLKVSILVRPENKGGKNYLTYWMDEYFSEDENTNVRIYLNEWSKQGELDKILAVNNDIVFNMDLLHVETFSFIVNSGERSGSISDCRFPIVYKPSPISQTSLKRRIELTQTQFSASFWHAQVVRYKKNAEDVPSGTYLAVRVSFNPNRDIIDMLHKKAYWVVCIDKVMDGALLRKADEQYYAIIGFSTGKGMYGQYNLTITARSSILETVEKQLYDRLCKLFHWRDDTLNLCVKRIMNEASSLDGISVLSAINQNGNNVNEFMAYVMTSMRERQEKVNSALKVIIHLDSYKHWFDNRDNEDTSMRPDFLMLSVAPAEGKIKLWATVIECKTAHYQNASQHIDKAVGQVKHGLKQLQRLFDPESVSVERRYWFAQLYRALVFAQVTFSDNSDEFMKLSSKLRSILDGDFEIAWEGKVMGYWFDKTGSEETCQKAIDNEQITIYSIPQERIQNILLDTIGTSYVPVDDQLFDTIADDSEEAQEQSAEDVVERERNEIFKRRKKVIEVRSEKKKLADNRKSTEGREKVHTNEPSHEQRLQEARVLIGKDRSGTDVCWEFGNKGLSNRHLLITGTSGQGKTYGIQTMLYEISKTNISMVVFDYTEGFRPEQLEKKFLDKMNGRIDNQVVYFTGVPIDPFKRHEIEVAGMKATEKVSDVAQRVASTLTHVYKFGDQQFAAIYDACHSGLKKYGDSMSMEKLESELKASSNKSANSVVSKMTPFVHSVEFSEVQCDWNDILYSKEGKLTIFQLTNFVREIQVLITEFMLWDMWHYAKKNGNKDKPFIAVLDEAQNLSHAENSPSGLILTEGRKFGWSAWYATQSLKVLNDDEVTRLMQSAFKLYFKPTNDEIVAIAKQLNPMDANEWKTALMNLKKGECIVSGDRIQRDGGFKPGRPTVTQVTSFENR